MLENSFIKLYLTKHGTCEYMKPISIGEVFIIQQAPIQSNVSIHLYELGTDTNRDSLLSDNVINIGSPLSPVYLHVCTITQAESMPANNTCMYVRYDFKTPIGVTSYLYSNTLVFMTDTEGISKLSYSCNEDAFGFPFSKLDSPIVSWLPINLKNPQLKQEDKTYVKRDGEVVVLMAKYYKEWEAESEYISEEMHDKIVAALSCDHVYINDVRLTKSDSYEIDWDNTIKKACGHKLAKATWKMRANITERNSNC